MAASLLETKGRRGDNPIVATNRSSDSEGAATSQQTVLKQTSGLQAGGVFVLAVGSYRFGRSPGSVILETGKPKAAQFGLTVDNGGAVVVFPPPTGLRLDGVMITTPTTVAIGQVIAIGHDRFELAATAGLERAESGNPEVEEELPPVPKPVKGRRVDHAVLDWAKAARDREGRAQRGVLAGPSDIHGRIDRGDLFGVGRSDFQFGRAMVATRDVAYVLPSEVMTTNRATLDTLEATMGLLSGVPVGVDLSQTSLAIAAPPSTGRAVASWLALSLAVQSNPVDLGFKLQVGAGAASWDWLQRFPHFAQPENPYLRVTITDDRRSIDGAKPGTILLAGSKVGGLERYGSVLTISAETATFLDRRLNDDEQPVSPVGISDGLALERSLLISDRVSSRGVSL